MLRARRSRLDKPTGRRVTSQGAPDLLIFNCNGANYLTGAFLHYSAHL
jgi:hypothetical protein